MAKRRFEYRYESVAVEDAEDLNVFGADGWQVVAVRDMPYTTVELDDRNEPVVKDAEIRVLMMREK